MKKGRHRRFEEARALKRSTDFNVDALMESLKGGEGRDEVEDVEEDDPYDPYANASEDDWR
ncbi:MAG: hypothetical protein S0880_33420 [Actinomycetota bacterium]|nr:hypothetical protein [Actinomycetota bacterium]